MVKDIIFAGIEKTWKKVGTWAPRGTPGPAGARSPDPHRLAAKKCSGVELGGGWGWAQLEAPVFPT